MENDENAKGNAGKVTASSCIMGLFGKDLNGKGFQLIHQVNKCKELTDMLSSNDFDIEIKTELIQILLKAFSEVAWNVCIITKSQYNLVGVLIKEMLNSQNLHYRQIIRKCLSVIYSVIDVRREDIDDVYQSLANHFRLKTITLEILLNHIEGLRTLYGEDCVPHKPNNFFYFNGSGYIVIPCISTIKIKEGFSMSLWFYSAVDQSISNSLNQKQRTVLVEIKCENDQKLSIVLNQLTVAIDFKGKEERLLALTPRQWYHFSFIIEPKKNKGSTFTYVFFASSKAVVNSLELHGFLCSNSIVSLSLYHNFIGKATSMLFLDKKIQTEAFIHLAQYFPYGFYKSKQVKKLIDVALNANSSMLITANSSQSTESSANIIATKTAISSNSKLNYYSMIYAQLKLFYSPFQCKSDNIEDLCGNINGQIFYNADNKYTPNRCNSPMDIIDVNLTSLVHKNIIFLGGINPLLPIIEKVVASDFLISNEVFEAFLQTVIIGLDVKKRNNIALALNENFFQCLSVFLEQLPKELFTESILGIMIQIANKMTQSSERSGLAEVFFTFVFFNEKIIKKFSIGHQVKLWNYVANCFDSSHYVFINNKQFMPIGKICVLLRFYDNDNGSLGYPRLYCCSYHGEMFNNKKDISIPDVKAKTSKLLQIAEMLVREGHNRAINLMTVIKMLTLDLSPCLQKGIIRLLIQLFSTEKLQRSQMVETVKYILHCHFLDIVKYCISMALFDVRVDVISLIGLLFKNYKECFQRIELQRELKGFVLFIRDNVYPNYLFIGEEGNVEGLFEEEGNAKASAASQDNGNERKLIFDEENEESGKDYFTPSKKPLISNKRKKTVEIPTHHFELTPDSETKLNQSIKTPSKKHSSNTKNMLSSFDPNPKRMSLKPKSNTGTISSSPFSLQSPFIQGNNINCPSSIIIENDQQELPPSSSDFSLKDMSPFDSAGLNPINRKAKHKYSVGSHEDKRKSFVNSNLEDISDKSSQQEESEFDQHFNSIKKFYTNSTQSIVLYYKEATLATLTNQMLSALCEWLLTEDKLIEHEYLLETILKLLSFSEVSHMEVFIRILNDIIIIDDRNNHILLSNAKFYSWLVEVLFQSYLLLNQSEDNEYCSVLRCNSPDKKAKAKQLLDIGLSFHSVLMLRANKDDIDKLSEVLLIGSKFKKINNNSKRFSAVINNYIRLLLNELLKSFVYCFSSQIEQSVFNKGIDKRAYFNKTASVVAICFEFIFFYNIEQKPNLTNETSIEISVFPDFLMSGMNLNDCGSSDVTFKLNASSNLLSSIWSDYELNRNIMMIFHSFWLNDDLNQILEEIVTKRAFNEKLNEAIAVLLLDQGKVSILRAVSAMHAISIILSQNNSELTSFLNDYIHFIQLCIILSLCVSAQAEDVQPVAKELMCAITFALMFLFEEASRKTEASKEIFLYFITLLFSSITKVLHYSFKLANKSKKQFFKKLSIKSKKKVNLRKCGLFMFFNEFVSEVNSSGVKEPILNEKALELMMKDQTSKVNQLIIQEKVFQALLTNNDLRNSIKDFFCISKFEKSCMSRLIKIARYHPAFPKDFNLNEFYSASFYKEKCRLAEIALKAMRFYKDEVMKCAIEEDSLLKKAVKLYQREKKKLFSWRGLWSNRKIYFEDTSMLKYKISNHLGSNLFRPLLSPIMDIDYYLPSFSQFNADTLFVHSIKEENATISISSLLKSQLTYSAPIEAQEHLEEDKAQIIPSLAYLYAYPELAYVYKELRAITYSSFVIPQSFELKSNKMFNCCYVKTTHHVKGTISILSNSITYSVNKWLKSNDEDYDEEHKACFGSTFPSDQKDFDILSIEIAFKEIKYLFKRTYFYKKSAIELFTTSNKSYFFNFPSELIRTKMLSELLLKIEHKKEIKVEVKDKADDVIGYEVFESKKGVKTESSATLRLEQWQSWKMSTFDFLLWLNVCANRSFVDILQYPVFPWIIAQYSAKDLNINEEHSKDLRDLRLPMGMMVLNDLGLKRRNEYVDAYNLLKAEKVTSLNALTAVNEPIELYHYGSLYSNPMYVSHFLTRLFPFANILVELQGSKFDDPNRLFFSIEKTFDCATTQKVDVRELCPEFYYLPEMFININDINFGITSTINPNSDPLSVSLPLWSGNNPYEFVLQMKTHLENPLVCNHINKWIDLIFGFKQKGKEAENAQNLFMKYAYEDFSLEQYSKDQRYYYIRLADFGLVPHQLFSKEVPNRKKLDSITFGKFGKQITQSQNLRYYFNKTKAHEKLLMLKMKIIDNDKVIGIFNNNQLTQYKFTHISQDSKYQIDLTSKKYIPQSNASLNSKMACFYKDCEVNCPIVIYSNGKIIAQGGYWDGHIAVYFNESNTLKCNSIDNPFDSSPVVVLALDKEEKIGLAGSLNGFVTLYKVSEHHWERSKVISDHSKEITSIRISNGLNMFSSCGKDGFVMLYTLPLGKLVRCVKVKDDAYADEVFLSTSPLPTFVVYSKKAEAFWCYSINGCFLNQIDDMHEGLLSPVVFNDYSFNDFLVRRLRLTSLYRPMEQMMDILY